jgi:dihydrofolate reductase
MAKLVYGMNLSLDGFVDHEQFAPDPTLFRHWIELVGSLTGSVYGRGMYEIMRYWDDDNDGWSEDERAFAAAWRAQPKWVISNSLKSVGPNATLVSSDFESVIRQLKTQLDGEIDVSGPVLAKSLGALGLIDEYQLYFHPVVLGSGKPFFVGPQPTLRLVSSTQIGENVMRLTYVPA